MKTASLIADFEHIQLALQKLKDTLICKGWITNEDTLCISKADEYCQGFITSLRAAGADILPGQLRPTLACLLLIRERLNKHSREDIASHIRAEIHELSYIAKKMRLYDKVTYLIASTVCIAAKEFTSENPNPSA